MADRTQPQIPRRRERASDSLPRDEANFSPGEVHARVEASQIHHAALDVQNDELQRLRLELAAARARFRDLFDFAPIGYLTVERDGVILEANLAAGELLGCARTRLAGLRLSDFIVPEDLERLHLDPQRFPDRGEKERYELQLRAVDGRFRHVAIEIAVATDSDGVRRIAMLDISERVAAEMSLRVERERIEQTLSERTAELTKNRELIEEVAEVVPLPVWIYDIRTRSLVYANSRARTSLGHGNASPSTPIPMTDHFDPAEIVDWEAGKRNFDRARDGNSWEATLRVRHAPRDSHWITSRMSVFERGPDGQPSRILGISMDVTELRAAAERTSRLEQEARLAAERERRDLSAMLHDSLGQLLPLANTKLALARRSCDEATRDRLSEVERIIREAHEAASSLKFRLNPHALREIGLIGGFQALAREMKRDYELDVVVESEGPAFTLSQAVEFAVYRVAHELLVNVAKHSGAKDARLSLSPDGAQLRVSVADRGRGFDPAGARIRGFGLRSAEERLSYLGCQMRVDSEPQRGTRVERRVPLLLVDGPNEG